MCGDFDELERIDDELFDRFIEQAKRYGVLPQAGTNGAPQPLGEFSVEGGLDEILGRFEKAVLERLFHDHPSSRQLGKRLGVSHTTIANKLRQHGLGKE